MSGMAFDPKKAREALFAFQDRERLKDLPWEKAGGVGSGVLRKLRDNPQRSLSAKTYAKLAEGAAKLLERPVTVAELQGEPPPPSPTIVAAAPAEDEAAALAPNADIADLARHQLLLKADMGLTVPVLGTAEGGAGDRFDFELNGTTVDYVRRPPRIAGRKDVFAAYVRGDSMEDWRYSGELIYAESARPPRTGDFVLVELQPERGQGRPALVKKLMGMTQTKISLRQLNPRRDFDIDRARVVKIYRVMEWTELLGS